MTAVRVSFVIASFNGAPYIAEQIRSILGCLGSEDEIVVSDDGSTDGTRAVVESLDDPRIILLPAEEWLGYQCNFARAIAASRGAFIFFSDQDDVCLPARLPASLAALEHAECACGDAIVVDGALTPLQESYFAARRARFTPFHLLVRPAVIGATMACRRDFVLANMPFPDGVPHDLWLSLRAALRRRLAVVREPFILYRRHDTVVSETASRSRRPILVRVAERWRLMRALARPARGPVPSA